VLLVCTVYSVLYSEVALSRKPFRIGHVYTRIYTFMLRMTDTMTVQNIDLFSCDILYMIADSRIPIFAAFSTNIIPSETTARFYIQIVSNTNMGPSVSVNASRQHL
jgi:hypothetical protein